MSQSLPREQGEEEEEKEKTTKGVQQQSWYSDFGDGGSKVFVHTSGNKQFCCEGERPESTTKEKLLELESWQNYNSCFLQLPAQNIKMGLRQKITCILENWLAPAALSSGFHYSVRFG